MVRQRGTQQRPFDHLECRDWLGFAGIPPTKFPAISPEEQFAEKLHAYTLPREGRPNSRVKDLVDLVLLIRTGKLDAMQLRSAIKDTFHRRKTHPVSKMIASPPPAWESVFVELASECGLSTDLQDHFSFVVALSIEFSGDAVVRIRPPYDGCLWLKGVPAKLPANE